jgi:hypothetical protein
VTLSACSVSSGNLAAEKKDVLVWLDTAADMLVMTWSHLNT